MKNRQKMRVERRIGLFSATMQSLACHALTSTHDAHNVAQLNNDGCHR